MLKSKTINIFFFLLLVGAFSYERFVHPVSIWIYVVIAVLYLGIQAYGSAVLSAEFFLPVRWKGANESNSIALTFDDGPVTGKTEEILRILKMHNATAAFFCIGNRVTDNPDLTRTIHRAGHLIGNHSYWHKPTFDLQSASQIEKELIDTDRVIEQTIGLRPQFFRPPYGVTNPMLAKAVRRRGYKTIGWSVRSFDTVIKDGTVLFGRITRSLKGGDVILLHDYSDATIQILPVLLEHIHAIGLKIVRVDELLKENPYGQPHDK